MIKGIIVILIALWVEFCAFWVAGWNPIELLKFAKTTPHKFGPISTFVMFCVVTILVIFFIIQGILLF